MMGICIVVYAEVGNACKGREGASGLIHSGNLSSIVMHY